MTAVEEIFHELVQEVVFRGGAHAFTIGPGYLTGQPIRSEHRVLEHQK